MGDFASGSFGGDRGNQDFVKKVENFGARVRETENSLFEEDTNRMKVGKDKDSVKGEVVFSEIQEIDNEEVSEGYKVTEFGFGADRNSKNNEFMNSKEYEKETILETRKKQVLAGSISSDKSHGDSVDGFYSSKVIFGSMKGMNASGRKSLQIEVVDDTALIKPTVVPKFVNGGVEVGQRNGKKKEKQELDAKGKRPRRKGKHLKDVLGTSESGEAPNDGVVNANGTKIKYNRKAMEDLRFVNIVEQRRLWAEVHRRLGHTVVNEYHDLAVSKYENYRLVFKPQQKKEDAPHFLGKLLFWKIIEGRNVQPSVHIRCCSKGKTESFEHICALKNCKTLL